MPVRTAQTKLNQDRIEKDLREYLGYADFGEHDIPEAAARLRDEINALLPVGWILGRAGELSYPADESRLVDEVLQQVEHVYEGDDGPPIIDWLDVVERVKS